MFGLFLLVGLIYAQSAVPGFPRFIEIGMIECGASTTEHVCKTTILNGGPNEADKN